MGDLYHRSNVGGSFLSKGVCSHLQNLKDRIAFQTRVKNLTDKTTKYMLDLQMLAEEGKTVYLVKIKLTIKQIEENEEEDEANDKAE